MANDQGDRHPASGRNGSYNLLGKAMRRVLNETAGSTVETDPPLTADRAGQPPDVPADPSPRSPTTAPG